MSELAGSHLSANDSRFENVFQREPDLRRPEKQSLTQIHRFSQSLRRSGFGFSGFSLAVSVRRKEFVQWVHVSSRIPTDVLSFHAAPAAHDSLLGGRLRLSAVGRAHRGLLFSLVALIAD